jgi:hypothetical protein
MVVSQKHLFVFYFGSSFYLRFFLRSIKQKFTRDEKYFCNRKDSTAQYSATQQPQIDPYAPFGALAAVKWVLALALCHVVPFWDKLKPS